MYTSARACGRYGSYGDGCGCGWGWGWGWGCGYRIPKLCAYSQGTHRSQHSPGRVAATKSLPQLGVAQDRRSQLGSKRIEADIFVTDDVHKNTHHCMLVVWISVWTYSSHDDLIGVMMKQVPLSHLQHRQPHIIQLLLKRVSFWKEKKENFSLKNKRRTCID